MRPGKSRAARWGRFLDSVAPAAGAGQARRAVFEELDRRYREGHRRYHAWAHIDACLRELDAVRELSPHPGALELALWFHDAVYEPGAADNEARSAALAAQAGKRLGLPGGLLAEAEALILATRHPAGEPSAAGACAADTDLVLDIDLAVFGRPWDAFAAYEQGIALEYRGVPEPQRRARRRLVLQGFLDRPRIYRTDSFRERYEGRARENLLRSIAGLG